MNNIELNKEEKELLKQYQTLSTSMSSLANRLAIEIVPPIIFIIAWVLTGVSLFLIVCIALMSLYNTQRVLRQYKNIAKLHSISKKTIGTVSDEKKL